MVDMFTKIKDKIVYHFNLTFQDDNEDKESGNLIALGVLLWAVAESDDKFLAVEDKQIQMILKQYSSIREQDMPVVMRAIKEAAIERIDLFQFAREVKNHVDRTDLLHILDDLFRVAYADGILAEKENTTIRTISKLVGLDHEEFANAKVKIKAEMSKI